MVRFIKKNMINDSTLLWIGLYLLHMDFFLPLYWGTTKPLFYILNILYIRYGNLLTTHEFFCSLAAWTFASIGGDRLQKNDSCHSKHAGLKPRECEITTCIEMYIGTNRYLCIGMSDGHVNVFDIRSSSVIRSLNLTNNRITSMVRSCVVWD